MKKLLNLAILLLVTTTIFAQSTNTSFISTYHLREKKVNSNIRSIVIVNFDIPNKQIQIQILIKILCRSAGKSKHQKDLHEAA